MGVALQFANDVLTLHNDFIHATISVPTHELREKVIKFLLLMLDEKDATLSIDNDGTVKEMKYSKGKNIIIKFQDAQNNTNKFVYSNKSFNRESAIKVVSRLYNYNYMQTN